jgi:hypothetical protein
MAAHKVTGDFGKAALRRARAPSSVRSRDQDPTYARGTRENDIARPRRHLQPRRVRSRGRCRSRSEETHPEFGAASAGLGDGGTPTTRRRRTTRGRERSSDGDDFCVDPGQHPSAAIVAFLGLVPVPVCVKRWAQARPAAPSTPAIGVQQPPPADADRDAPVAVAGGRAGRSDADRLVVQLGRSVLGVGDCDLVSAGAARLSAWRRADSTSAEISSRRRETVAPSR